VSGEVLRAERVTKRFGGLTAVNEVDFEVSEGEIVGLIGPNGAGKTTFFNCLTGMEQPTEGRIAYRGRQLEGRPYEITSMGLARTFQNIRLFPNMTALENVLVGRHCRTKAGAFSAVGRGPLFRREERDSESRARELLEFVNLGRAADSLAKNLPYGDQRRLEIARAVASGPRILLLDEPNAGMNPVETQELLRLIRQLRDELKITIVLVAHDIPLVMNLCDRIQVLNYGRTIAEGDPAAVRSDEAVIAAYIGRARSA